MIQFENVSFGYKKPLFSGLNLTINQGDFLGLLGKNGAGKTTFLKLLCGLLKPQKGVIRIDGRPTTGRNLKSLENLHFVPEKCSWPNVSSNEWGHVCGKMYPSFSQSLFSKLLTSFEVDPNILLNTLSFGNQRKAILAFAFATQARILSFDEPSNGLDISSQDILRETLISQSGPDRIAVISTHHVREFSELLQNVIVVHEGSIKAHEKLQDIQSAADFSNLESYFLKHTNGRE